MKKTASIVLVALIIIGMMAGYVQAFAQEGNELEELIGLKVKIVYQWTGSKGLGLTECKVNGTIVELVGNSWIIVLVKKRYAWCYIPTIRYIEILDKNYRPAKKSL